MEWAEYYEKFYDWAESTQIKKLSLVEALGPGDEDAEVMMSFAFDHDDIKEAAEYYNIGLNKFENLLR